MAHTELTLGLIQQAESYVIIATVERMQLDIVLYYTVLCPAV